MLRNTLTIGRVSYELVEGTEIAALKESAEDAVRSGGRFVEVTVVGDVEVSVLVSAGVTVLLTSEEVPEAVWNTSEPARPFDMTDWELTDVLGL